MCLFCNYKFELEVVLNFELKTQNCTTKDWFECYMRMRSLILFLWLIWNMVYITLNICFAKAFLMKDAYVLEFTWPRFNLKLSLAFHAIWTLVCHYKSPLPSHHWKGDNADLEFKFHWYQAKQYIWIKEIMCKRKRQGHSCWYGAQNHPALALCSPLQWCPERLLIGLTWHHQTRSLLPLAKGDVMIQRRDIWRMNPASNSLWLTQLPFSMLLQ